MAENCKQVTETEEDTCQWKGIPCWCARINIVQVFTLPTTISTLNAMPVKIPMAFFTEIEETILKPVWDRQRPTPQSILRKKSKAGDIAIPDVNVCYKAAIIKQYSPGIKNGTYINGIR